MTINHKIKALRERLQTTTPLFSAEPGVSSQDKKDWYQAQVIKNWLLIDSESEEKTLCQLRSLSILIQTILPLKLLIEQEKITLAELKELNLSPRVYRILAELFYLSIEEKNINQLLEIFTQFE